MSQASSTWRMPMMVVIICGCLISFLSFGGRSGFGLFLGDVSDQFFGGKTVIFATSLAIQNVLWGAASPVAGALADKYGSGKVLGGGAVLYTAGMLLVPVSSDPWMMYLTSGVMVGLGVSFASFSIVISVFSRTVTPEKRSLAMGVGTAAGSIGQAVLLPTASQVMISYDWQTAVYVMAVGVALIVPLSMAVTGKGQPDADNPDQTIVQAIREAVKYPSFNLLTIGFFVCGFHVMFIQVHLPKYLATQDLPAWVAGATLSMVAFVNVVGAILAGYLGTKYSKRTTLALLYFCRSLAILAFIMVPVSPTSALVFGGVMGLFWLSTVPLTSGLVAHFFGVRYMATLFGIVFFSHQLGAFLGIWLGGAILDATGSYDIVWWIAIALGVAAALIHLPIKEAPVQRTAAATA